MPDLLKRLIPDTLRGPIPHTCSGRFSLSLLPIQDLFPDAITPGCTSLPCKALEPDRMAVGISSPGLLQLHFTRTTFCHVWYRLLRPFSRKKSCEIREITFKQQKTGRTTKVSKLRDVLLSSRSVNLDRETAKNRVIPTYYAVFHMSRYDSFCIVFGTYVWVKWWDKCLFGACFCPFWVKKWDNFLPKKELKSNRSTPFGALAWRNG